MGIFTVIVVLRLLRKRLKARGGVAQGPKGVRRPKQIEKFIITVEFLFSEQ